MSSSTFQHERQCPCMQGTGRQSPRHRRKARENHEKAPVRGCNRERSATGNRGWERRRGMEEGSMTCNRRTRHVIFSKENHYSVCPNEPILSDLALALELLGECSLSWLVFGQRLALSCSDLPTPAVPASACFFGPTSLLLHASAAPPARARRISQPFCK